MPFSTCMGGCKSSHWWNDNLKNKKPSRGLIIWTESLDLRAPTLVKREIHFACLIMCLLTFPEGTTYYRHRKIAGAFSQ